MSLRRATKAHPERVAPAIAAAALELAKGDRQLAWTQYILLHFRRTGQLAPGCDLRDLWAWYEAQGGQQT